MAKRILIVEDQEDNRMIMRDVLSSAGYDLIEAVNGEAGVKLAHSERPDLILMDIQLPTIDGYEATRRIKGSAELKSIPIIAVTSYALSGDQAKARPAHPRRRGDQKGPASTRTLLQVLRTVIGRLCCKSPNWTSEA